MIDTVLCVTAFLLAYCVFENWYLRRKIKRLTIDADNWKDICERYKRESRPLKPRAKGDLRYDQ